MRTGGSRWCAGALVAVLAATLLLPVAALARVAAPSAFTHGCHCPVKMACCEAGLCHGEMDTEPSDGPSWSGCRDEAPHRATVPPPSTAFDGALLPDPASRADDPRSLPPFVAPGGADAPGPTPSTPPPRASIASC